MSAKNDIHAILIGAAYLSNYTQHTKWHSQFISALENDELHQDLKAILCNDFYLNSLKVLFPATPSTTNFVDILVDNHIISNQSWLVANLKSLIGESHLFHFNIHINLIEMILKQLFKFDSDKFTESVLCKFAAFDMQDVYPADIFEALNLFFSYTLNREIVDFNLSVNEIQDTIDVFLNKQLTIRYFDKVDALTLLEQMVLSLMICEPFDEYVNNSNTSREISLFVASSQESLVDIPLTMKTDNVWKTTQPTPSLIPTLKQIVVQEDKRQDSKASINESNFEILEDYHKPQYLQLPPLKLPNHPNCDFDKMVSDLDLQIEALDQKQQSKLIFIDIDGSSKDHTTYLEERSTRREKLLHKLRKVTHLQKSKLDKKPTVVSVSNISLPKLNTKTLIKNAIFMLLAGAMSDDTRSGALQSLERSKADYHIISLKDDKNHSYKALYRVESKILLSKIHGNGPLHLSPDKISNHYKFDCGGKRFRDISQTNSNEFHASVHAIVVVDRK